jgi:hypothetical protein
MINSVSGSRPVIVAGAVCPSENSTSTEPPLAAIVTTEGTTPLATGVSAHTLTVDEPGAALEAGAALEVEVVAATMTHRSRPRRPGRPRAPPTAATGASVANAWTRSHRLPVPYRGSLTSYRKGHVARPMVAQSFSATEYGG